MIDLLQETLDPTHPSPQPGGSEVADIIHICVIFILRKIIRQTINAVIECFTIRQAKYSKWKWGY